VIAFSSWSTRWKAASSAGSSLATGISSVTSGNGVPGRTYSATSPAKSSKSLSTGSPSIFWSSPSDRLYVGEERACFANASLPRNVRNAIASPGTSSIRVDLKSVAFVCGSVSARVAPARRRPSPSAASAAEMNSGRLSAGTLRS
jgi:hypothetical protein